jgi:hypothetical protein
MTANYAEPFGPHDPFGVPSILIAAGPDYVPREEAPLYAHDWAELLEQCRTALARRVAAYPGMIARRLIEADVAATDIAAWELLVAEWHWIVSGQGKPPGRETIRQRMAAVDLAMIRVRHELDKGGRNHDLYRQAHLIQALHWNLVHQTDGEPCIHSTARFNHSTRRAQNARYCEMCDRWLGGTIPNTCSRTNCGHPERQAA